MRRSDREVRDRAEIQCILEVAKVLRLGLTDGDYPYIVPLRHSYAYVGNMLRFYMYDAREGKKLMFAMPSPHAFVEFDCEVETTREGGIVYIYGTNYASLMVHGEATMIEDPEEKIKRLEFLMRTQIGRDLKITTQQTAGVAAFRSDAESYSVKEREKK